jgi:hypothetical protein
MDRRGGEVSVFNPDSGMNTATLTAAAARTLHSMQAVDFRPANRGRYAPATAGD